MATGGKGLKSVRRAHLLALEPRMMFDAAVAATTESVLSHARADAAAHRELSADAAHPVHAAESQPAAAATATPTTAAPAAPAAGHEIIFIDTSVANYQQLAAEWASRGEVVLINDQSDGLAQVEATLAHETDVSAIHIVSHGSEGALYLGTTRIDEASITGRLTGELAQIGRSIEPGGDILLYGCDFAEGGDGAAALHAFATATGANVAASTGLTGAASGGGNWTLEAHSGTIDARALSSSDYAYELAANPAIPIAVTANTLTVTDGSGTPVVTHDAAYTSSTGIGSDGRSPDVGVGATAVWANAATTADGQSLDLVAKVVALSPQAVIQFNAPGGTSQEADDATFLLTNNATDGSSATVQVQWELVYHNTTTVAPADVEFTIGDIDGIGGQANSRETVSTSTDHLAYYTRENVSDIAFTSSLQQITASGTQNENTNTNAAENSASNASFDWTDVNAFTLTYTLTNNTLTNKAQFYQDGNATLKYTDPVYVSIPRLDLDADDSTASGNDAHFTYTEDGHATAVVDSDVKVTNPMDVDSIVGATVVLTNEQAGDQLTVDRTLLPSNISDTISEANGQITVTFSGKGSEADYEAALKAVSFSNTLAARPSTTQRVIDVTFSNDTLTSATAVSRIDVVDVNHAPSDVGTLTDQSTQDAATVSYATAGGFTDIDGDTLRYSATGLPAGLTIDAATGVISGTVDHSASQVNGGAYTVVVTATDPSSASATQSFHIGVTNPPPVARNDSATVAEDSSVRIAVLANDSDPDGDALTVTSASAAHGSVVINSDGTLTYTPTALYRGTDTINYAISDGQGGTSAATVAVTITPVNHAPADVGTLADRTTQDAATVSYATAGGFTDVDGDTLRYSATGLPAGLTIDTATGVISGTVDHSASQVNGGAYMVVVTATDPSSASATQSFHIGVTNPPPVARNDSATVAEDSSVRIAVLANDSDPDGDALTVTSASAAHGSVVINSDGTLTYTPTALYRGTDTISYAISDGQGGTSAATVAVTITPVDHAPTATSPLAQQSTVDSATVSYATAGGFTDVDGDGLTYAATGLPQGLSIDAATGVISGTLGHSDSQANGGHYDVVVTATDPSGASATQGFAIDVANPAPHAGNDRATTHVDTPADIDVLANDSDPDGDPIAVTAATAAHGAVSINPDGTLRYTPDAGFAGTDTIAYTITDGDGATAHATVAVTVSDTPPAAAAIGNQAAQDGQAIALPVGSSFADADGDTLSYSATGLPAGLSIDAATGLVSGTIDRSASQVAGGVYTTIVTADDGHGGTTSETFHWTITNPAPTARNDSATTPEETAVVIAPLANDSDPDGDPLFVESASAPHGSVAINADGTLTYTPDAGFTGTDTIAYAITDGQGGHASASVAVSVTPVDHAPTATPLAQRADADGAAVSVPTAQAFSDRDGDTLTYSATGLPAGVSIDPATGIISGTLGAQDDVGGPDGAGHYAVTVTATDPSGLAATSSFGWTVARTAPIAQDDHATTPQDMPITIDVLGNDSDPAGLSIAVTEASAVHGSVSINPDGTLGFTPDTGFRGDAVISYTITDSAGNQASATATVSVTAVDHAPVATPIPATYGQDGQSGVAVPTAGYFADPDGDTLRYAATGLPPGLSLDPATGLISGTIDHSASTVNGGVYQVVVTATDPSGQQARDAFTWTITNPAPTAHDDSAATSEATPVTIDVLANDVDPDGDALAVTSARAGHGTVAVNPDNTITYTPDAGFVGQDVISYGISDGQGGRSTAAVVVSVAGLDQPPVANPDQAQTRAGEPVTVAVLANDSDPNGDALAVTGASAQHGSVAVNPDGTITYTPAAGYSGADTISYAISDGRGGTATSTVAVSVAADRAPVARPDQASTVAGTPVTIAVLANDADPDGDALSVTGASAGHGAVVVNPDGTITYTPAAGYSGADTISYAVSDGHGGTATSIVAVTIAATQPPVAHPDQAATRAGEPVTIPVLANDSDPAGLPLTVAGAGADHGSVAINPDGTITYTPAAGFAGTDTIRYTASDGHGGTAVSTASVSVAADHAPTIDPRAPVSTAAGRPITIDGLAGAHDADGDPLTITSATAAAGTVAIGPGGTLVFTPAPGFVGTTSIRYTVDDGHGGTASATIVVRVGTPGAVDVEQQLAIGQGLSPAWRQPFDVVGGLFDGSLVGHLGFDPARPIALRNGLVRSPFPTLSAVNAIRSLDGTPDLTGATPVADAVEGALSLDGIGDGDGGLDGVPRSDGHDYPVAAEVARLGRLADFRDAAARLFDRRWGDLGDFGAHPFEGFSAAADGGAGVQFETLVQGGAIYLDVRDTAPDAQAGFRSVDVTLPGGDRPDWIVVDKRGFAIIEAGAADDEIHLVVTVTRTDGSHSSTPLVIQRQSGEIELDRHGHAAAPAHPAPHRRAGHAAPLDATLHTPHAAAHAAAHRLSKAFQ